MGYTSFSGIDIKAVMGGKSIANLQGISYSVSREKAPIFTMGSADARGFARGKRGIAGSLVFIQFDFEPILGMLSNPTMDNPLKFLSDIDDLRPEYLPPGEVTPVATTSVSNVGSQLGITGSGNFPGASIEQQESQIGTAGADQVPAIPWYPDQLPPFDVVLAAANEYGMIAIMKILGVEIMNAGFGISIDDIVAEHSYTWIGTGIVPWTRQPPILPNPVL
jgi:hypothetical protein